MPVSEIAAAIGVPARARILYRLMDDTARTSTELSAIAEVSPSTASVHLKRLEAHVLVTVVARGRHRYYRLAGPEVATALEALSVLTARSIDDFVPATPEHLRTARTCYDHIAGRLGVALCTTFESRGWIESTSGGASYEVSSSGICGFEGLGIDMNSVQRARRRLAFPCMDWSERSFHVGGALGAAVLKLALQHGWVRKNLDSRVLEFCPRGRRALRERLDLKFP